jgi:hypothetical protein
MSSYAKVRKELAEQSDGGDPVCRTCKSSAPWQVLSDHGGQCFSCFQAHCRASMPPQVDVGDKRRGQRDWAYALQRRHKAGDQLTPAQIDAYTAALRHPTEDSA